MTRPVLSVAVTRTDFQNEVVTVFIEALERLSQRIQLPRKEPSLNSELFLEARNVQHDLYQTKKIYIPFVVIFDAPDQPTESKKKPVSPIEKRPDFTCALFDGQAIHKSNSYLYYHLECKRLGRPEPNWVLNTNYSTKGISRFVHNDWQYGKDCPSGAMIGYLQNMQPSNVLSEVNNAAAQNLFPALVMTQPWGSTVVYSLDQPALTRSFNPTSFLLKHLWVDLTKCQFIDTEEQAHTTNKVKLSKKQTKKHSNKKKISKKSLKK